MGLYRRHKVWWMNFTYKGQQVRRSTDTTDRRLAETILAKVTVDLIEGRYFEKREEEERTFKELMERYTREHVARQLSKRAFAGYTKNLLPFFAQYRLADITPKLIVQYKGKRYADGVAPATINRELACMKKAFNLAIREWEWCRENPVSRVSMEKENNKRDRWLSCGEEDALLSAATPWLREVLVFALNTGMRMGEIRELTWEGVDLFRRTVTVFRSKNGERRTIPINQVVLDLLKARAKVRSLKTDFVFCSHTFTQLDDSHLRRAFRSAVKDAEIQDLHFHDLRHTFATRLVQSGVDLYKVQCLLGHKTHIMTQRYAHHYPESLRDGVEILERYHAPITNLSQSAQAVG